MKAGPASLNFAFPGDLQTRTGGYIYDAQVINGLKAAGIDVRCVSLPASFPSPTGQDLVRCEAQLATLPEGEPLIIDGLAFGVMDEMAPRLAAGRRLVALVHHPLALESGLPKERVNALVRAETDALAQAHAVVVTSPTTAATLAEEFGVPCGKITVARPGTLRRPLATGIEAWTPRLLAVGAVSPRKDFLTLVHALAEIQDRSWRLTIAGTIDRDKPSGDALKAAIAACGMQDRIVLAGELDDAGLELAYAKASIFVSSALYEGYGMALMDAIACGLPIVATRGGAVGDVLPADAALLSPPGDVGALSRNLTRIIDDIDLRLDLAAGARPARNRLPTWEEAVAAIAGVAVG